jgi:hypothetical protein
MNLCVCIIAAFSSGPLRRGGGSFVEKKPVGLKARNRAVRNSPVFLPGNTLRKLQLLK